MTRHIESKPFPGSTVGTPLRRAHLLAALSVLVAAALYFVLVELHRPSATAALDVYIYYLPNKMHALSSLWDGGKGLLWNRYQSCGVPFFANPAMGLLYPPHLVFLFLEPNLAVHVVLIINMVIGGIGMLLLARELGLGWAAALAGALVFELGDPMAQLTGWSPMQNGPWAWLPWALLLCERLLRAPTARRGAALAVVLALELAPGWVLITALTYQLIVLRVVWELLTTPARRPWRSAAAIGVALAFAPGLLAVQLLPAAEFAAQSSRVVMEASEFAKSRLLLVDLLKSLQSRTPPLPFLVAPLLLAALAVLLPAHRRLAAFYVLVGALYGILALGQTTPLYSLYLALPPGAATVRYSLRLFWMCGLSLALLTAFGLDAFDRAITASARRWLVPSIALLAAAAAIAFTPDGLRWGEMLALALLLAALFGAAAREQLRRPAAWIAVAAVLVNLVAVPLRYPGRLVSSLNSYWRHRDALTALEPPLTAQDRLFIVTSVSSIFDFSLITKTATLLRLPDIFDYDALMEQRHTQFFVMMWHGSPLGSMDEFTGAAVRGGFRGRLLDLTAVRTVAASPSAPLEAFELPRLPSNDGSLRLYRNDTALPRARYVPRIEVIADPNALLNRLAFGSDDLRTVAFVEAPTASGFTGVDDAPGTGTAEFVTNDPEHVVIDVDAPARGFLVLADEYYPGWQASVNGTSVPILRANYTFRLVEVPAGHSRVEFRFRPPSVAVGAAVSLLSAALLFVLVTRAARPRRSLTPASN